MKAFWIIIIFLLGAIPPLQTGLSARLGKTIQSPLHASMVSFLIGTVAVSLYILITRQHISWQGVKTAPLCVWTGGFLGAILVTVLIFALPRLGASMTFGMLLSGQIVTAVLLDHFNILVPQQHSINMWRIAGVIMVITGIAIIRKF
jgi:transporter family-2 protein